MFCTGINEDRMSALSLQARVNTRAIKKLEKPRPLKISQARHTTSDNRLSSGGISGKRIAQLKIDFFIVFCVSFEGLPTQI